MAIAGTAKKHFVEDIKRARKLVAHTNNVRKSTLRDDILRSSWMMAVGAADAFFCDAYADFIARTLQAKQQEPETELSSRLADLRIPVAAVIRPQSSESWRWRMVAREMIERQTVLDLVTIKQLFNHFFHNERKLFGDSSFDSWVLHPDGAQRLFGINKADYRRTRGSVRNNARKNSKDRFAKRFKSIFQRRHDCIHNCDRVRIAINPYQIKDSVHVNRVIDDIEFLVFRCVEEFQREIRQYLLDLGFSGTTCSRVSR